MHVTMHSIEEFTGICPVRPFEGHCLIQLRKKYKNISFFLYLALKIFRKIMTIKSIKEEECLLYNPKTFYISHNATQ